MGHFIVKSMSDIGEKVPLLLDKCREEIRKKSLAALAFLFLVCLLLPGAVVFTSCALFGVCVFCAAPKKWSTPLFAASAAGYILSIPGIIVLKYLLALIAVYALKHALIKADETPSPSLLSIFTALSLFVCGGIFVMASGFLYSDVTLLCCEVVLGFCSTYLFINALSVLLEPPSTPILNRDLISVMVLVSLLFLSLSTVTLGDFSIGRFVAVTLVICITMGGNSGISTISGVILGLIMGLCDSDSMTLCAAYSLGALFGSLFFPLGRFACIFVFMLVNGLICLYSTLSPMSVIWIYEVLAAGIVALLIPKSLLDKVFERFMTKKEYETSTKEQKINGMYTKKLFDLSYGYKSAFKTVSSVCQSLKRTACQNPAKIIDGAAEETCKKCRMALSCWGKDYNLTAELLHKTLPVLKRVGFLTEQDFPDLIRDKCIKKTEFAAELTRSFYAYEVERKVNETMQKNKSMECSQFISMADSIENLAKKLSKNIRFDHRAQHSIENYLSSLGLVPNEVVVIYDEQNRVHVEIYIRSVKDLTISREAFLRKMSSLCAVSLENLEIENRGGLYVLVMTQKERFDVIHAVGLRKKDGEDTSGDRINTFRHEGQFVSTLCDAMGSGKRAAIDSSLACCVVENIVKGGFDGEMAIKSLNTALMIGNEEDRVTSVDIAAIDLFTGKAVLYKAGGAPTYAKKGNTIHRLFHPSLPVGILENTQPQQLTLSLQQDDILIMLSDGICDGENDGFIKQEILSFKGNDLNALCERIIENAVFMNEGRSKDDMSVIAMKLV